MNETNPNPAQGDLDPIQETESTEQSTPNLEEVTDNDLENTLQQELFATMYRSATAPSAHIYGGEQDVFTEGFFNDVADCLKERDIITVARPIRGFPQVAHVMVWEINEGIVTVRITGNSAV